MKVMKSYRMDDTLLGMMDYIKENTKLETDTEIIRIAITNLWLDIQSKRPEIGYIFKDEYLHDK